MLVNTYGAVVVYRMTDNVSGTTIIAYPDTAFNGVSQGLTLQSTVSPVVGDSGLAPDSDAVNDYANILTTSLENAFNPDEMSLMVWGKFNSATWNDGSARRLAHFTRSGGTGWTISFVKAATGNFSWQRQRTAGGIHQATKTAPNTANWFMATLTISVANNRLRGYWNDTQEGVDATGLLSVSGAPTTAIVGALTLTPTQQWRGSFAYAALFPGIELSPAQVATIYNTAVT